MYLLESLSIGLCAWVATGVLFQPGNLLAWYWFLLDKWEGELPARWRWIVKPLGKCGYCYSGQLGFWFFILSAHFQFSIFSPIYTVADNAIFALQSIFFWAVCNGVSELYKTFLEWLRTPPSA